MTIKEWTNMAIQSKMVCREYKRKLENANTKEELFKIICDPSGGNWIFHRQLERIQPLKEQFKKEFENYLNGKVVMSYNGIESTYTSKFYVDFTDEIIADTTVLYLLDCKCHVKIPSNQYPNIVISDKSEITIDKNKKARADIDLYGEGKYTITGDKEYIRTYHRRKADD